MIQSESKPRVSTGKVGRKKTREVVGNDKLGPRVDEVMAELLDIAWSALASEGQLAVSSNPLVHDIHKCCGTNHAQRILMTEVYAISQLALILGEVSKAASDQALAGMTALAKLELAKPIQLTATNSRWTWIRQRLLRSLFNAADTLDDDGERTSAQLGVTWFASPDDALPYLQSTNDLRKKAHCTFRAHKGTFNNKGKKKG